MYYRYKSKNRNNNIYKYIILLLIVSISLTLGYKYKKYLLFWKYTYSKLEKKVNKVESFKDKDVRQKYLLELCKLFDNYKEDNQLDSEAFFLSGKVHFLLGELYLKKSFSQMVIDDSLHEIDENSRAEFYQVIKDVKKGIAVSGSNSYNKYHIILAKAIFYLRYSNISDVFKIISRVKEVELINNVEDIRFLGVINIISNNAEFGVDILKKHGKVQEGVEGILFLATVDWIGRRYTNSIMEYKLVLNKTSDSRIIKLAHVSLGKIYYNQSLYRESLSHFNNALKIDERDNLLKIWIGKNYSALGYKTRARAIWSEVLVSDEANEEARKLLGLM